MKEENGNVLLNFIVDELKDIKADLAVIRSEMVTKDYCQTMQKNCPIKEDMEKKTILNLVK